jgi:CRISPR-associated protein Csm3
MSTQTRCLLGKIVMTADMTLESGLHIGAAEGAMHVGGIDKSVVRDPLTGYPYVPGSSLRGKLRSLLERRYEGVNGLAYNRDGGARIKRHECDSRMNAINCPVCGPFGSTGQGGNHPARLIVRDGFLTAASVARLRRLSTGTFMTEWKFENAIDRITSAANPRQLERVPKGATFCVEFAYTVEDEGNGDAAATSAEDLARLREALVLLEADALGGNGSRGYGKVSFSNVKLRPEAAGGTPFPVVSCPDIHNAQDVRDLVKGAVDAIVSAGR